MTTEDQSLTFFPPTCPNAQVRLETGSSYLPDCRAYELVSPGDAGGSCSPGRADLRSGDQPARALATRDLRDPSRPGPAVQRQGDLYVAERTGTGWKTSYVGLPSNEALEQGGPPTLGPGRPPGSLPTPPEPFMTGAPAPRVRPPRRVRLVGAHISTQHGEVLEGALERRRGRRRPRFLGDVQPSADFSHVFFSSLGPAFVDGAPTAAPGSAYDDNRVTGEVEVISTSPQDGPILQDPAGPKKPREYIRFPAVSADGSRVLMSTAATNGRHLYMRVDGETVDVSLGQDGENHGVEFIGMTKDGSRGHLLLREPLTADDHDTSTDIFVWHEADGTVTRASTGSEGAGESDECATTWTSQCDATFVTTQNPGGPSAPTSTPTTPSARKTASSSSTRPNSWTAPAVRSARATSTPSTPARSSSSPRSNPNFR